MSADPPEEIKSQADERQLTESQLEGAERAKPSPNAARRIQHVMEVSTWQGPIPPPDVLLAINEIIPDGAERILKQFESETAQRHKLEKRRQLFPFIDQALGRLCAIVFAVGCLGVVAYAISRDQEWAAVAIGGALIVAGINAFLRLQKSGDQ